MCKSARIFAQVGPYLELGVQFAAGNFIRDALQGQPIVIKGDGTPLRSYMYPTDLVAWLWAILVRGHAGSAYNVGSDQSVSIRALAETIVRIANARGAQIQVLGQPAPGAAPDRYVPNIERARTELGLSITVPFEDALRRTIEWYRPQIMGQLHD
jgi:nucleoside-diphosphate-sugar epimerase